MSTVIVPAAVVPSQAIHVLPLTRLFSIFSLRLSGLGQEFAH